MSFELSYSIVFDKLQLELKKNFQKRIINTIDII